jgi:hypothetical protein
VYCLELDLISLTIQNKSCLLPLFIAGVHGKLFRLSRSLAILHCFISCTAHPKQLDTDENAGRRSHEHTNQLLQTFDPGTLWDDYGVVAEIIVSCLHFLTRSVQ